jgi:hypothetical protein
VCLRGSLSKKKPWNLESTASQKQKNHGFRSAPTHGFSRCPIRFSLLRPTGRLAEKEASPKIKTAQAKEPVDHLTLLNNILFHIALNQYPVRIILSIQKKSLAR